MQFSGNLPIKNRTDYIRFLIKLLHKKYGVTQAFIAHQTAIEPTFMRDFIAGRKQFSSNNLDITESFIMDLYEGILLFEIPQDNDEFKNFVMTLSELPVFLNYYPNKQ